MKLSFHWSQLDMARRCLQQYYWRYIRNEVIPPGVALLVGSGTHRSVERNMRHRIEKALPCPLDEAKSAARDYISGEFERGAYLLTPEDRAEKSPQAWRDEAVDTAVALSELHYREVAPGIKPISVEREWVLEIPGAEFDLAGRLDIEEARALRDTKTSARSPSQRDADTHDQFTVYGLERYAEGLETDEYHMDALVKTKTPKAVTVTTTRSLQQFEALLAEIGEFMRLLQAGAFPPTGKGTWICDPKWCGYYRDRCPYVRGYKVYEAVKVEA